MQALVVGTTAPNPRRVVSGVDGARVAMLIAVLEKRCRIKLSDKEIYVSTVGGIRLAEPGSDLAIALAIAVGSWAVAGREHAAAATPGTTRRRFRRSGPDNRTDPTGH